jgi:hypothetical protein
LSDFSYISGSSSHNKGCIDLSRIYNTALIALNTARGSRLYPSKIYLTGAMANAKNIGAELTALLETNCEQRIYEQGTDQPAGAELSTLIGVMRGIYRAD